MTNLATLARAAFAATASLILAIGMVTAAAGPAFDATPVATLSA